MRLVLERWHAKAAVKKSTRQKRRMAIVLCWSNLRGEAGTGGTPPLAGQPAVRTQVGNSQLEARRDNADCVCAVGWPRRGPF
jgi:hypothetical protein